MGKGPAAAAPLSNQLLNRLSSKDYTRILPHLQQVSLKLKQVLIRPHSLIDYVYFPNRGVVSAVTLMKTGTMIEVATIGNEGLVGLAAFFGTEPSPDEMVVQVPGDALRVEAKVLRIETSRDGGLRQIIGRYHAAYLKQISQGVACNGLHPVKQRCCRWILMTHDRALADEFPLTHEFLSHMLGVRRVSVTDVLKPLQKAGFIRCHRGRVTVKDRRGLEAACCECYQSVREEFQRRFGDPQIIDKRRR